MAWHVPVLRVAPGKTSLRRFERRHITCLHGAVLCVAIIASPAPAEPVTDSPRRLQAIWTRYWKEIASQFVKVGDEYYSLPRYDDRHASSARINPQAFIEKHRQALRFRGYRTNYVRHEAPDAVDASIASMVIPGLKIGEYGYIHSGVVGRVLGKDDMVVREIWYVDNQKVRRDRDRAGRSLDRAYRHNWDARRKAMATRFVARDRLVQLHRTSWKIKLHLHGYDTSNLVSGKRWTGPSGKGLHIAIVGSETDPDYRNQRLFVAVAMSRFKKGLGEQAFRELVEFRGFTIEQFAALIQAERKKGRRKAVARLVAALEGDRDDLELPVIEDRGPLPPAEYCLDLTRGGGMTLDLAGDALNGDSATYEAWIAPRDRRHAGLLFWDGDDRPKHDRAIYYVRGELRVSSTLEPAVNLTVRSDIRADRWTHVAVVIDDAKILRVYVDGTLATEKSGTFHPHLSTSSISVGRAIQNGRPAKQQFYGRMTNIRVWARALEAEEIAASIEGTDVDRTGLLGQWDYDAPEESEGLFGEAKTAPVTGEVLSSE
ncbi:MAG: hypothetical protein CMJ18_28340 [Phycisphaeraceae bacterium]|nr:hypothetical protein [Phycisphaeraceae bacterium]